MFWFSSKLRNLTKRSLDSLTLLCSSLMSYGRLSLQEKGHCSFKRKVADITIVQEKDAQPLNSGRVNPFPEANFHFNVSVNESCLSSLFIDFFCIMLQNHINISEGRMDE